MRASRIVLGCLALACVLASPALAQTGGLKVLVYDENGEPLPGAIVTLSSALSYVKTTSEMTDPDGAVLFPVLRVGGGYKVEASFAGYTPKSMIDLKVRFNATENVQIQLIPELTEKVVVKAGRETVDLGDTQQSTKFSSEFIQDLPVQGRFYQNVLTLAPGVLDTDGDGNPNVHGSRERDFKAQVNGISNQDPLTGQWMSYVNSDSIEEIEVVTSGASVEYGRAQGGFANVIQKQGSNEFEGVFSFIFRSSKLDGNGATNLTAERLPEFSWYQPALQISGPILKDKLWYRLSHEYHYIDEPVNTLGSVEVTKTRRSINDDQVTWQASPRNKLALQLSVDPQTYENVGVSSLTPAESSQKRVIGGPTIRASWTAPYSAKFLVETVVGYQDQNFEISPQEVGVKNNCIIAAGAAAGALESAQCFNADTGRVSGSFFQTWEDQRQRLTVKSDATYYAGRLWGMDQQFKFGLTVENERYARQLDRRPFINFFTLTPTNSDDENDTDLEKVGIALGRFSIPRLSDASATGVNWAVYARDELRPLSNLTVTLGFRLSQESIASKGYLPFDPGLEFQQYESIVNSGGDPLQAAANTFTITDQFDNAAKEFANLLGIPQSQLQTSALFAQTSSWINARRLENIDITNTNLEPEIAVSWDPWKDGKTKIAAKYIKKYDKIFLGIPLTELEPPTYDLRLEARNQNGQFVIDNLGQVDLSSANITVVDRELRTPYTKEFTFTVERELWTETSLRFSIIKKKAYDQLQDLEMNHLPGDYGRCIVAAGGLGYQVGASPGTGTYVDPYTGKEVVDNDPGDGDGFFDDCAGELAVAEQEEGEGGGPRPIRDRLYQIPDGILDAYTQNPAWSEIYQVGNYNRQEYSGYELVLSRRQYKNWQMEGSYTFSRARGDAEDYLQVQGDDRTILDDEYGYQGYDRRHVVKVNATTITPWGFRLGGAMQWMSGEPYSLLQTRVATDQSAPSFGGLVSSQQRARRRYITGQRNDQRNEGFWNFDLSAAKEMNLKGGMNLQVRGEIFNLLNDDSLDVADQVNGFNNAVRRFGRRFQVTTRLAF